MCDTIHFSMVIIQTFIFQLKVMVRKHSYIAALTLLILSMLFALSCTYNEAEEIIPETIKVSYKEDIQPIIAVNCYSCHTANATDPDKAGYAFLDDFEEVKRYALKPSTFFMSEF